MRFRYFILPLVVLITLTVLSLGCIQNTTTETESVSIHGRIDMEVMIPECASGTFNITLLIKNAGNTSVPLLKPITFVTVKFELYYLNGTKVKYMGPVPSYIPLTDKDVVVLKKGEVLKKRISISTDWWNADHGSYQLLVVYNTEDVRTKTTRGVWRGRLEAWGALILVAVEANIEYHQEHWSE